MTIDTPANEHVPARHTFFAPVATVLIILVSLVLRVEYYRDLSATPLAQYHLAENSDMNFFHQWGMNIASGDILSSKAPFPITLLYKDVARKFLAGNPSVAARLAQTSGGKSAEEAVWGVWFGKGFYQEPLYPYLVAATYYLFGADPRHVFIWQMLLGVMTNLLLFTLARKYFGDLAACFTALIAVFYGPSLFNDLTLLRTTLNVFLAVSLIWIVSMVMEKRGRLAWFALGLAVGVAMLSKTIFVLYFISIIPLLYYRHGVRRAVVLGAMALAGITLALSPAVVRNMEVGAPPMALATGGALAFVSSNSMGYNPWRGLAPSMRHVPRIMGETSGKLVPAMVATLRTHDGPLSYLSLLAAKFSMIWDWREISENVNYYYFRIHSPALRGAALTFFLVAPLALVGALLSLRMENKPWPLLMSAAVFIMVLLGFMVIGRYRAPLVAAMIPFAGYALSRAVSSVKIAAACIAAVLFYTQVTWNSYPEQRLIKVYDYSITATIHYYPAIAKARKNGDMAEVARIYQEWITNERMFGLDRYPPESMPTQILRPAFNTFTAYAKALDQIGKGSQAAAWRGKAGALGKVIDKKQKAGSE